ncbi:PEP-CTERM sorting domain-containing protein [Paraglaciecola aestuariivivens]
MKKATSTLSLVASATLSLPAISGIIHSNTVLNINQTSDFTIDVNLDGVDDLQVSHNFLLYTGRLVSSYYSPTYERTMYSESKEYSTLNLLGLNSSLVSNGLIDQNAVIDSALSVSSSTELTRYDDYFRGEYNWRNKPPKTCRTGGKFSLPYDCSEWSAWSTTSAVNTLNIAGSANPSGIVGLFEGYVGFSLNESDGEHFGWLNLSVNERGLGQINSYAYNTVADEQILAGQTQSQTSNKQQLNSVPLPSTLSLFILGAAGVVAGRRKSC